MPELKGRGLFVFSDPGGAKPILAWIDMNRSKLTDFRIISDRSYNFFDDFNLNVSIPDADINNDFLFKPDFVFTGTSYTSKIELKYIEESRSRAIPTFSYVDHWTSIRNRFEDNTREIFPDYILVLDERAKQIAHEQGINVSKLVVTNNPYYDWLRNWKPSISKQEFLKPFGIKDQSKILLYAPDPLSNVNGFGQFGFDEISATTNLVDLFKNRKELASWIILVKPHPNQQVEKLANIISEHPAFILLPQQVDTNTAIYHADIIVGFFSAILIEATVLNKPVLRFLESTAKNDPFSELRIGTRVNRDDLVSKLLEF